ncbi:ion transporter, partial [bacterium]|nr:ion transporter [bacterium]
MTVSLFRKNLYEWLNTSTVRYTILAIIIINAVILGIETSPNIMREYGSILTTLDNICLTIFVLELMLKLFSRGLKF